MSLRQAAKVAFSSASRGTREVTRTSTSSGSSAISRMHLYDCVPKRGFASGEEVYEGLKLHKTGGWHAAVGKGIASVMWFWIFYRFYHDYDSFLFGHAQHFEHELHETEKEG
eukprot:jgi/Picsp_1/457/NSC_00455-R1_protein